MGLGWGCPPGTLVHTVSCRSTERIPTFPPLQNVRGQIGPRIVWPMGTAAAVLLRLWDVRPKLGFAVHLLTCVFVCVFFVVMLLSKVWAVVIILSATLLLDVGTLVAFTREAASRNWSPASRS